MFNLSDFDKSDDGKMYLVPIEIIESLKKKFPKPKETISLTFGDCGENHVGMEKIGSLVKEGNGFNLTDFEKYKSIFEKLGCDTTIYNLNEQLTDFNGKNHPSEIAYIMVVKNGLEKLLHINNFTIEDLYKDMDSFEWDHKYFDTRRKKVLNKHARANVCFGNSSVEPNYEEREGRIVGYDSVSSLKSVKEELVNKLGSKCENMICEGNRYYDLKKCGIGWHGDAERRKVLAFRIGDSMDLRFNWFYKSKSVGETFSITLNNGDMYMMSEKAVGHDWKKRNSYTLRHSAGMDGSSYLNLR